MDLPEGFEPNSYGARYFRSIEKMSRDNLLRRQKQLEGQTTYTMDEECRRMVALQCVTHALSPAH